MLLSKQLKSYLVHPDHQILASIGLKLLQQNYQIGFYIDQPYMIPPIIFKASYRKKMIKKIYQKYQINCQIRIIKLSPNNRQKKNYTMHQYKSQFDSFVVIILNQLRLKSGGQDGRSNDLMLKGKKFDLDERYALIIQTRLYLF